jgi:exopolysaccharide biosynthesis polyprenyl glycosylphosphotransferase
VSVNDVDVARVVEWGARRGTARRTAAQAHDWERRYVRSLIGADALIAVVAAAAAYLIRFNTGAPWEVLAYSSAILFLPLVWCSSMALCRAYETRFLGVGSEEFRRVTAAAMAVIAGIGTSSWALGIDIARGFVVIALPAATLLTLLTRYLLRRSLHARRARGYCVQRVVVVGHVAGVSALTRQVRRADYHGMRVVAACVPGGVQDPELELLDVDVAGSLEEVVEAVLRVDADAVAVLPCPELDGAALRRLGWALEVTRAELLVAPAITEVVGPRIAIRPICGLPLLHVERPELTGVRRVALVAAPVLAVIGLLVKLDSSGPVFFRQTRVGRDGRPFTMLKLRTMVVDAEQRIIDLRERSQGNKVLFKMHDDPRITRMGRLLRRYSLDELPQLINVLRGDMSLVGPRPPLPAEVALYEHDVRRRLMVKPGLSGLWQISGRSDLDWDESVRLDLRYVENWSFAFDFMILWKTAGAVLKGRGAY